MASPIISVDRSLYFRFESKTWNQMVVLSQANDNSSKKHIYRLRYMDDKFTLELKTDEEIKNHHGMYGNAASQKLSLSEVINLTRIINLNQPVDYDLTVKTMNALGDMSLRAQVKYRGILGTVRRMISIFANLFVKDLVVVFYRSGKIPLTFEVPMFEEKNKNQLPRFIGSDATFARLVMKNLNNNQ